MVTAVLNRSAGIGAGVCAAAAAAAAAAVAVPWLLATKAK
jgi:hypothetical protein